jgi:hypothetical protein
MREAMELFLAMKADYVGRATSRWRDQRVVEHFVTRCLRALATALLANPAKMVDTAALPRRAAHS